MKINNDKVLSDFSRAIAAKIEKDTDLVTQKIAQFVDTNVIKAKFDKGFPGHELTEKTKKKKGSSQVGVDSGRLLAAATAFVNWSLYPTKIGTNRPSIVKKKYGLTEYSHMVKTKKGGKLDFIGITEKDLQTVELQIKKEFGSKKYKGDGKLRLVKKSVEDDDK